MSNEETSNEDSGISLLDMEELVRDNPLTKHQLKAIKELLAKPDKNTVRTIISNISNKAKSATNAVLDTSIQDLATSIYSTGKNTLSRFKTAYQGFVNPK